MRRSTRVIIDLVVVVAALAVLAFIVIPGITSLVSGARAAADTLSLQTLNEATAAYRVLNNIDTGDAFSGCVTNEARIRLLLDAQLLSKAPAPQQSDAAFQWNGDEQAWVLAVRGEEAPLTALGSTFTEISSAMVRLELDRKAQTGAFGRSWGSYAYTDIGLDPKDWAAPIGHIDYKPCGAELNITPEEGYMFVVEDATGKVKKLPAYFHWSLVCDCATGTWYYHVIAADNEVDIGTLRVVSD